MSFGNEDDQALQAVIGGLDHDQMDFKKLEELLSMQANEFDVANPDILFDGFPDQTDVQFSQNAPPEDLNSLNEAKDLVAYVNAPSTSNVVGVLSPPHSDEDPYSPNSNAAQQAVTAPQGPYRPDPHLLAVLQNRYPGVPLEQLIQRLPAFISPMQQQRLNPAMTPPRMEGSPLGVSQSPPPAPIGVAMATRLGDQRIAKKRKYEDPPQETSVDSSQLTFQGLEAPLSVPPHLAPPPSDLSYQSLKWQAHCPQEWVPLLDSQLKPVILRDFQVEADKGFNFSTVDDAFVCQKKNHFQVTCLFALPRLPQYIQTSAGPKPLESLRLHVYGMKLESQSSLIKVEQSQPDRSKKRYDPAIIPIDGSGRCGKMTVGRLHFSETTANNMRKKGKPNPDQRYFSLVVSLRAHCSNPEQHCVVASQNSERIIVRASNPGQFENDAESTWKAGQIPETIYYSGRVGVNTDRPEEALVVHGNVRVTGKVQAPSDERAKEIFGLTDTKQQLKNVAGLPIYQYRFKDEVAEYLGLPESDRDQVGVLAQELKGVLPDAVKETDDIDLPSGEKIEKFLVVDKDRLYMENVGAVKELCKLTDALEDRIGQLEKIQKKLKRNSSRTGSLAFSASGKQGSKKGGSETSSEVSSLSTTPSSTISRQAGLKIARDLEKHHSCKDDLFKRNPLCTPRFMQGLILLLIVIMATSAVAMAVLFALSSPGESPTAGSSKTPMTVLNGTKSQNQTDNSTFPDFDSLTNQTATPSTARFLTTQIPTSASKVAVSTAAAKSLTTKPPSSLCCNLSRGISPPMSDSEPEGAENGQTTLVPPLVKIQFDRAQSTIFNATLLNLPCNSCRGNVTYSFELPVDDLGQGDLNMALSSSRKVKLFLCSGWGRDSCSREDSTASPAVGSPQIISSGLDNMYRLTLPVFQRVTSNYTLRAVEWNANSDCSSNPSDAGTLYTLYVFEFARVCGLSTVTIST